MSPGEQVLVGVAILAGIGILRVLWKGVLWALVAIGEKLGAVAAAHLEGQFRVVVGEVVDEKLESIRDELSYNGGKSVKDMVRRIEQQVETLLHETR